MNCIIFDSYNDISKSSWDKLVQSSAYSNVFQTRKIYKLFDSIDNYNPFVFACTVNNQIKVLFQGVIIREAGLKKNFSKRAIVWGGPILDDKDPKVKHYLQKTIETVIYKIKKEAIYLEIRNFNNYDQYKDVFKENGFSYSEHLNFKVNCENMDLAKSKISKSKRRQINKSIKAGAEIFEADSEKDILEFYEILKKLYRNKVKKPLMPKQFFLNFYKLKVGKYLLIKYQDKIVGGIMCPILDVNTVYEWFVVGQDAFYPNIYPSVLSTWAAIDYANKNNIKTFDFMGAGKPNEDYGVREFKSKFGGDMIQDGRFIKIFNPFLFRIGKLGLSILKFKR